MAKHKKQKKKKITIWFRDGKSDVIPQRLWDDYEINGGQFVVKKKGAWIAVYNLNDISCWGVG